MLLRKPPLILFLFWTGVVFTQTDTQNKDAWLDQYQAVMDGAAKSWVQRDYAKALDGLSSARSLLSYNMPLPTEIFQWRMYRTLKTYALLLTRLVELDMYITKKDAQKVFNLAAQAQEWADNLDNQKRDWQRAKARSDDELLLRKTWVERFESAIDRARLMYRRLKPHEDG